VRAQSASRDTQNVGENPIEDARQVLWGGKAGHLLPWALGVRPRGRHTSTEECLDEARRATEELSSRMRLRKRKQVMKPCTEHLTDSAGEVVDLVDADGNMLIGE